MKRVWYGGKEYSDYEPHYPESEEISGEEQLSLQLDADIEIFKDGSWEYEDQEYPWATSTSRDGVWYSESSDYPAIELGYPYDIVEYVDSLLEPLLPFKEGRYHISGDVELVFTVSDIIRYYEYLGQGSKDEDDPVYDEDFYVDDAEVEFEFDKSSIDNFEIEEL